MHAISSACSICNLIYQVVRLSMMAYYGWFLLVLLSRIPSPGDFITGFTDLIAKMDINLPVLKR